MGNRHLSFGPFEIDPERALLTRDGVHVPVGPRAVAVLAVLAAARGNVVTKSDLVAAAWKGLVVEESNLSVQIANLRRILGPGPNGQPWITTLPRVGYRLTDVPVPGISARDLYLRGRALVARWSELNAIGRDLLLRALAEDSGIAPAQAWLSHSHHFDWMFATGAGTSRTLAIQASRDALRIDPVDPDALWSSATVRAYGGDLDGAFGDVRAALNVDPDHAEAWLCLGDLMAFAGRPEEAVECTRNACRLNPLPPACYWWHLGYALYAARRYEEAIAVLDTPALRHSGAQRILAAALFRLGRMDDARRQAYAFARGHPHFSCEDWGRRHPFRYDDDRTHFVEAYLAVGLAP